MARSRGGRTRRSPRSIRRTEYVDAPITEPRSPHQPGLGMWCNSPHIHKFIREMREKALAPYGAVSVGGLSNTPFAVPPYVSAVAKELDRVFEHSMIRLGTGGGLGAKYILLPVPAIDAEAVRVDVANVYCVDRRAGRRCSARITAVGV